jgi:hypothetical protein
MLKEDVKDVRLSVDGADVAISKVVLHWNNRPDDTEWMVGTVKGGRTNGCEVRSRTRGDPQFGDGQLQNPC